MSQEELRDKLAKSDAVVSLLTESKVASLLAQMDWATVHSFYYPDPESGKDRELDVIGRKIWVQGDDEPFWIYLSLLVECKSSRGIHVVVSPLQSNYSQPLAKFAWVGRVPALGERLAQRLQTTIPDRIAQFIRTEVMRGFGEMAYPADQAVVAPFVPDPPRALVLTSAFRETDTKKDKELDASVLWRATQTLHSAMDSLQAYSLEGEIESWGGAVEVASKFSQDPATAGILALRRAVRKIFLFHPVIVTESPLWSAANGSVTPLPAFRLLQLDAFGTAARWADVVRMEAFPAFLEDLNRHYDAHFKKLGAGTIRPDLHLAQLAGNEKE